MDVFLAAILVFSSAAARAQSSGSHNPAATHEIFNSGHNIVPNEGAYYLLNDAVRNKTGILISVGTFRALETASRGNFSQIRMVDIDPVTVEFNQRQIRSLRLPRVEFLSSLLPAGDARLAVKKSMLDLNSVELYQRAREALESAKETFESEMITKRVVEIEKALIPLFGSSEFDAGKITQVAALVGRPGFEHEIDEFVKGYIGTLDWEIRRRVLLRRCVQSAESFLYEQYQPVLGSYEYVLTLLEWARRPANEANFLSDEGRYRKLKTMAVAGRITAKHGDLIDPSSYANTALRAETHTGQVSVVDVSNSMEFFKNPDDYRTFARNVNSLHLQPQALMIFTADSLVGLPGKSIEGWYFFAVPLRKATEELSKMFPRRSGDYFNFLLGNFNGEIRQCRDLFVTI